MSILPTDFDRLYYMLAEDSSDIMFVINDRFELKKLNQATTSVLGWNNQQHLGQSVQSLSAKQNTDSPISPEIANTVAENKIFCHQTTIKMLDYSLRINWTIKLLDCFEERYFLICGVVNDQPEIEATLQLHQAIDCAPGSIYWKDLDGYYLGCNQFMVNTAGYTSADAIIGKTDADLWPSNANRIRENDREVMLTGHTIEVKESVRLSDGTLRHYTGLKMPLRNRSGHIVGIICNSLDITELENTKQNLEKAKNAAELADRAKTKFLENVRHDLRTPVHGIVGLSEHLCDQVLNDETKNDISDIYECSKSLLHTLNQMLELSKTDLETIPLQEKRFSLKELVDDIYNLHKPAATNKNLDLIVNYSSKMPIYIMSDQLRIHRILLNLISNAIKFSEAGQVSLFVRLARQLDNEISILFEIIDTGIGIPHDQYQAIFIPFNKLESSYPGKYSGSGLGLSIVKKSISELGGEIDVKSVLNKGTTFTCIIPCKISRQDYELPNTQTKVSIEKQTALESPQKPLNILLVEDNRIAQRVSILLIEQAGHVCDIAETGQRAIELAISNEYDLIMMDIGLPDMDGIAATREILKHKQSTPIIALSAHLESERLGECLNVGIQQVLDKPLTIDKLLDISKNLSITRF